MHTICLLWYKHKSCLSIKVNFSVSFAASVKFSMHSCLQFIEYILEDDMRSPSPVQCPSGTSVTSVTSVTVVLVLLVLPPVLPVLLVHCIWALEGSRSLFPHCPSCIIRSHQLAARQSQASPPYPLSLPNKFPPTPTTTMINTPLHTLNAHQIPQLSRISSLPPFDSTAPSSGICIHTSKMLPAPQPS